MQSITSMIDQQIHREQLSADSAASTAGQGFTLSVDQAHVAVKEVDGFLQELVTMKLSAQSLQILSPPATDLASTDYNHRLTQGAFASIFPFATGAAFDAAATQIDNEIRYLETLRAKLYKALGMTVETDADSKTLVEKAGQDAGENQGGMAGWPGL